MAGAPASVLIGPAHDGTRMSLDEFADADVEPGYIYELEKGVIVVVDVPGVPYMLVRHAIRDALVDYKRKNPERIYAIADGSDAVMRMPEMESERHPDISVYLTPPPVADAQPWEFWIPEIVVEVVTSQSRTRDYKIKPREYLDAGVRLYWIIDPDRRMAVVLTRRADQWREETFDATGRLTTALLPGFELRLDAVFGVAGSLKTRRRPRRP